MHPGLKGSLAIATDLMREINYFLNKFPNQTHENG